MFGRCVTTHDAAQSKAAAHLVVSIYLLMDTATCRTERLSGSVDGIAAALCCSCAVVVARSAIQAVVHPLKRLLWLGNKK
jgi:hypothetical protein